MNLRRRLTGLVAVLAIAWGALWPLVSAAGPREPSIPNIICTQSGFHHQAPAAPREDAQTKFHCALCVSPVDATPTPVLAPPLAIELPMASAPAAAPSLLLPRFSARSPPSRAPPLFS